MENHRLKGCFISLEGGEGAGKTTLLNYLSAFFKEKGFPVLSTREPGSTLLGEMIRQWLLQVDHAFQIDSRAELLLFLSARAQHIQEKISPALKEGTIVLCDRFNDSTIAYQGAARRLGVEYVQDLCRLVCGDIQPELTLFLDISPEIGVTRSKKLKKEQAGIGQLDRIEAEDLNFHRTIQYSFQELARNDPLRIRTIDANQSPEDVNDHAVRIIEEFLISRHRLPSV